jgi:TonB family protein
MKFESVIQSDRFFKNAVIASLVFHLFLIIVPSLVSLFRKKPPVVKKVYLFEMVNLPMRLPEDPIEPVTPREKPKPPEKKKAVKEKKTKALAIKKSKKKAPVKEEKVVEKKEPLLNSEMQIARPNFPFNYYEQQIIRAVERNWNNTPKELLGSEMQLVVVVAFQILKNGQVTKLKIMESSWNSILDKLALRAIEKAKIPPIPGPDQTLSIKYRLVLKRA